jgi:hypothetical protein
MSRSWTRVNTLSSPPEGGEIFDRQNEEFSVGIDIALGRVLTQRQCQDYYCSFETGIHETILQMWGDLYGHFSRGSYFAAARTAPRGSRCGGKAYSACLTFFAWYNHEHHHSGIALLTPEMLHYGIAGEVIAQRQQVLNAAYARNPERFTHARPIHPPQPTAVWINPPTPAGATERNLH